MITNTGKSIIAKYLLGHAPAYASYIALGCGTKPLNATDSYGDYSNKKSLDFEMFRVPISSKGFINENGVAKIVLTGELPTEERYEISEIGVYSAGANTNAGLYDSKTLLSFTSNEKWQYHTSNSMSDIPTIIAALDTAGDNVISTTNVAFQTNADNSIFYKPARANRYERCRFLNNTILLRGDMSALTNTVTLSNVVGSGTTITYTTTSAHKLYVGDSVTISGVDPVNYNMTATVATVPSSTTFTITNTAIGSYVSGGTVKVPHFFIGSSSNHIHLNGASFDLSKNSGNDEVKLAFSLINKNGESTEVPDEIRIVADFASTDDASAEFTRFETSLKHGTGNGEYDFSTNRYFVITKKLTDLFASQSFAWKSVTLVKFYITILKNGSASSNYYIALDALRLDNISTENPLYGLIGYSTVKNTNAETVIKNQNTNNYIEFRFVMDVT